MQKCLGADEGVGRCPGSDAEQKQWGFVLAQDEMGRGEGVYA